MLNPLVTQVREGLRYKGRANQVMWVLHRISGLGVLLFLIIHIFGMSMAAFNPPLHETMLNLYKTPLFSLGELALAACLIFHSINGTRVAILDLRPQLWEKQEVATRWAIIITLVLLAPTLIIMAYKSISHFMASGL
jgi:succinate dehydrogenase / fumarate reductase cytochrome b subunit